VTHCLEQPKCSDFSRFVAETARTKVTKPPEPAEELEELISGKMQQASCGKKEQK